MDGVHDLGGMEGFGPVPIKTGNANFRDIEDWEKRLWGLSRHILAPGINIDSFRHGLECMVPADYLAFPYFEKWCTQFLMLMVYNGTVSVDDVRRGHVANPDPPAPPKTVDEVVAENGGRDTSFATEQVAEPAFRPGQRVRTQRVMPGAHTRLPRYARDARGTIIAYHGCHLVPDLGVQGIARGDHLYTVAFTATELWGGDADPRDDVTLDLWEGYLVQA